MLENLKFLKNLVTLVKSGLPLCTFCILFDSFCLGLGTTVRRGLLTGSRNHLVSVLNQISLI